jgi:hypothetical protein
VTAEYPVRYAGGAEGRALSYSSNLVLGLVAAQAYAPGQPLVFELRLGESWVSLSGKSQGSRARDEGGFELKVRLTNLRREARLALEQAFSARPGG